MVEREDKSVYRYTFPDRFKIKISNFFWKIIDILSCKIQKIGKIYDKLIMKEYLRETEIFEISKSKRILHIGCGSYPITSVTLSSINDGEIVGIDKSLSAITRATKIISNKNLGDRVSVKYGDGSNFPLEGFDTIVVSSCSIPKYKILEHLFEDAPSNCKIVVREQFGPNHLVSDYIKLYNDKVSILKKIDNSAFPTSKWESYCLLKK